MDSRVLKMNSGRGIISCLFTIIVLNAIHSVMSQYEPLYITKSPLEEKYYLIFDVKSDSPYGHRVVRSPEDDILLACPKSDYPDVLEIRGSTKKKTDVIPLCSMPIESHVFMSKDRKKHSVIGFLNHAVCASIFFKFDYSLGRIRSVRYKLSAGKLLNPEIHEYGSVEYQKDENIFKYDVDILYAQTSLALTKVPLAPEEDFLFASWKSASRHNIQTAPMWTALLPQWRALEIFIRKVTQSIDSVNVITGAFGTLAQPRSSENTYLYNGLHSVPKYFWKALYIEIGSTLYQNHYHGIIFVMHNNDPNYRNPYEGQICPEEDVIASTGWAFLHTDQFKTLMYGCFLNEKNMRFFREKIPSKVIYKPFNLADVPIEVTNDEGVVVDIQRINVLNEL